VVHFQADGDVQVACKDAQGDGALITGLSPGTQSFTVHARRGADELYASAAVTVTVAEGQTTSAGNVQAHGIPDDLAIFANFRAWNGADAGWSTCSLAHVATIDYVIQDYADTTIASGTVYCTDPAGISFTGANALDRDNYVIRMRGFASGASTETFDSASTAVVPACSGQAFDHYGRVATGDWEVFLFDTTGNTTVCP
jgi:hypothetical protein